MGFEFAGLGAAAKCRRLTDVCQGDRFCGPVGPMDRESRFRLQTMECLRAAGSTVSSAATRSVRSRCPGLSPRYWKSSRSSSARCIQGPWPAWNSSWVARGWCACRSLAPPHPTSCADGSARLKRRSLALPARAAPQFRTMQRMACTIFGGALDGSNKSGCFPSCSLEYSKRGVLCSTGFVVRFWPRGCSWELPVSRHRVRSRHRL